MSVKSLLQLILLLLIVLIIGGIYFLYFYSKPIDNDNLLNKNLEEIEKNLDKENLLGETISNNQLNEKPSSANLKQNIKELEEDNPMNNITPRIVDENKNKNVSQNLELDNMKNLSKKIEYITTNDKGDIFKIIAKYGKTNLKNSNILDLEQVDGIISTLERSQIYISSNNAEYNYANQNSKFYNNVKINYDNKEITCDNLDLNISENLAVAYNNVVIKNENSLMKAQIITLDIITKDININSDDKIKIFTN